MRLASARRRRAMELSLTPRVSATGRHPSRTSTPALDTAALAVVLCAGRPQRATPRRSAGAPVPDKEEGISMARNADGAHKTEGPPMTPPDDARPQEETAL